MSGKSRADGALRRRTLRHLSILGFISLVVPFDSQAQTPSNGPTPALTIQLPPLTVTAQKEPADPQTLPVSVTTVQGETLDTAGIQIVSDAGIYAPNVHFSDFTARKLSNPRFRGIGSSPSNPAVTTYLDGVPQLNANSSSIDLLQIDQIEFVRGPLSPLFGRDTLGGVINVNTRRPALAGDWTGGAMVPFANNDEYGVRLAASGPVVGNRLGASVAFQYGERDGYTRNVITGNDLDSRSGYSGKAQLLWAPSDKWEARVIFTGEHDDDGDYALSDLGGLRTNPFQAARDFEGFTHRDVKATTVLARWDGRGVTMSSTTGFVSWQTEDSTDLDYLPLPLATRNNQEDSFQFTQEVRLASPASAPIRFSDNASLRWQGGVFIFTQNYEQNATNTFAPFVVDPLIDFPISQTSPQSELDDVGVGFYGQGTVTLGQKLDLIGGVRFDHEQKDAELNSFSTPPLFPPNTVSDERTFTDVSPQFAAAYRLNPAQTVYGSLTRGFKAGGFNAASPPGAEAYDEEHTWSLEGGVKTAWAGGRVWANASVFRIDWQDLQLNLPNPFVPGQFFIDNAGSAVSSGVEVEVTARALAALDVFGSLGYTHARFDDGVLIGGSDVGGNEIPDTPDFTATIGAQASHMIRPGLTVYGRGETTVHGAFMYDEANTEGQDTYSLVNLRGGVRFGMVKVEAWMRNAFDTKYIPIAFSYQPFAPSGFIGEMGRPRTFGIDLGVAF
ncbi:MAG TPA: TonB-dependent receptor [Vicinamibacterales bacterium]|nr:TonB-dependent receptor [Vicinamibacterales bacterium]